jgi:hypothetical protein
MADDNHRRDVLRKLGLAAVGMVAGGAALQRNAEARVFAARFLKDNAPTQVPPGYYDDQTQLYHEAASGEPMFVCQTEGEAVERLSDEQLSEMLRNGRFVDITQLQDVLNRASAAGEFKANAWWTPSRQRTLSTTSCCPIVTDVAWDTGPDDTPPNPGD